MFGFLTHTEIDRNSGQYIVAYLDYFVAISITYILKIQYLL